MIRVLIADDGRGFDPREPGRGFGLAGMRERAALAGGTLTIESAVDLPDGGRVGPELETTVYRLVQEALTNVAKHARAEHARVAVGTAGGRLAVEIADDGTGFDPDTATSGFGLAGMRERVALSGGELDVTPGPSGTTVRALLPLSDVDEAVVEGVAHEIGA